MATIYLSATYDDLKSEFLRPVVYVPKRADPCFAREWAVCVDRTGKKDKCLLIISTCF
jgi:hypothetical protein